MFIRYYPYLTWSLMLGSIFAVIYAMDTKHRKMMIWGGLSSSFFAIASIVFVPDYWHPTRVFSYGVGPEDLIFSFANGGMIWTLATWPFRKRIGYELDSRVFLQRFVLCSGLGATVATLVFHLGASVMGSFLWTMGATGFIVLLWRRELWSLSVVGSLGFITIYSGIAILTIALFPDFPNQWNHEFLWGVTLWSLPLEEYAWALGFGAVFPLILALCSNAEILGANVISHPANQGSFVRTTEHSIDATHDKRKSSVGNT